MDGGQGTAAIESFLTDGGDAVGDGHGDQAGATRVFATYCKSIYYILNGRKVITLIL